jgi:hypothetical protein
LVVDTALATTLVSTSAAVIVGVFGMFINSSQLGKQIDDTNQTRREFRAGFNAFRDTVTGKLASMDLEIAKLMDRGSR